MRLKKARREEYKKNVRELESKEILTIQEAHTLDYSWFMLCANHYSKLLLELKHIANYLLIDKMAGDCLGEIITTGKYFNHYKDDELNIVENQLLSVSKSLDYLQKLIDREKGNRRKGQLISFPGK